MKMIVTCSTLMLGLLNKRINMMKCSEPDPTNSKPKKIFVKIEKIKTGEVLKEISCGKNQKKADKLTDDYREWFNQDDYIVYQRLVF